MGFLRKFMEGRYGVDQLGHFTVGVYLALYLVGLLVDRWLIHALSFAAAVVTIYRMLSRDLPRRRAENQKYLAATAPARSWWRRMSQRRTDKAHKYFRCPNCGQSLRVPRGAGKIRVTCRACGTSFEENS